MSMPLVSMDITDDAAVRRVLNEIRPEEPIHCAAWGVVNSIENVANQSRVKAVGVDEFS